jgi:hypothetical protein
MHNITKQVKNATKMPTKTRINCGAPSTAFPTIPSLLMMAPIHFLMRLPSTPLSLAFMTAWNGIHQIINRNLSAFRYLCQQLVYQVLSGIFWIASKNGELLWSHQQYPANAAFPRSCKSIVQLGQAARASKKSA